MACSSGMTTALPPNYNVGFTGSAAGTSVVNADSDMITTSETGGGPTFAAVTARSYHAGGVNALFVDGSVRFIKSTVAGLTWRALGSVNGGEVVSADSY